MRNSSRRALPLAAVAFISFTALAAAPASGAQAPKVFSTFTVSAGSAPDGRRVGFAGNAPTVQFWSRDHGHVADCTQVSANMSAIVGTNLPPYHLIRIQGSTFSAATCTLLKVSEPVVVTGSGTWTITGFYVAGPHTISSLSHISLHFESANPEYPCSYDLTGSVKTVYFSDTEQLEQGARLWNLHVANLVGCAGASVNNADTLNLDNYAFAVRAKNNPAYDPLRITQP